MSMNKTKKICITAIGIALYVVLSMTAKIPLIGHISLDLGYIVLAVYCYMFGGLSGAIVGSAGCSIISLICYGMFPYGWFIGNLFIGIVCGNAYDKDNDNISGANIFFTIFSVFVGILFFKTIVECSMFDIPLVVKIPKNLIASVCDSFIMCIGCIIAPKIKKSITLNGKRI